MDAKEYLSHVKELQDRILEKEEYIERLRSTLGIAGIRYDIDRVQTSPDLDRFAHTFSKIFDAEDEVKQMKESLMFYKVQVIDMIQQMPDLNHRKVLNCVYLDYLSLKKCAEKIHYSYDYVRELHVQALNAFEELYPTALQLNPTF